MQGKIKKSNSLLKCKKISANELAKHYLKNAEKNNRILNSYITINKDIALSQANIADKMIAGSDEPSLLCAIPAAIKDNICTREYYTTCASKMLSNYESVFDAFAVERLKDSGAVILGKTNMDEFAMGSTCETSYYGAALNPFDITKVAGGSSGGSAAAVASDMCVYSLGSDTGGSVRLPASFCGCVGLKPTYGSVSRYGLIAYASSFDQIGILASSVEDAAFVFEQISVRDEKDATCTGYIGKKPLDDMKKSIRGMKMGIFENALKNTDPAVENAVKNALKTFENLGAKIYEIKFKNFNWLLPAYYILSSAEAASNLSRYDGIRYGYRTNDFATVDEMILKSRTEGFGDEVKRRIMFGNYVLSSKRYDDYYLKAQKIRSAVIEEFESIFADVDVILGPTSSKTAFKIGEFENNPIDMYFSDSYTVSANLCGLPAISIPCGYDENNMPIGMQLMGNRFCENMILKAAYAYENEFMYKKPQVIGEDICNMIL